MLKNCIGLERGKKLGGYFVVDNFFFQAEDGIRDIGVTGVQTCALPILDALAVPTLLLEAAGTLDDTYAQLETLGDATGHAEEAEEVIADVQDRITAAVESVPDDVEGMKVFHELDPSFFSADSSTFIGSIYAEFGLENIADGVDDAAGGYPQLSAEYIVGEAPDLIVLADTKCCEQSAATVSQRPAFDTVPAVKEDRVLAADPRSEKRRVGEERRSRGLPY